MVRRRKFTSQTKAFEYMRARAAKQGERLHSGVGNDMSAPFYVWSNRTELRFYPKGINGDIVHITIKG